MVVVNIVVAEGLVEAVDFAVADMKCLKRISIVKESTKRKLTF